MSHADDRIEAYIRRVAAALPGSAAERVEVLAELRDHLHEARAAGRAAGLSEQAAAGDAIARLGSPSEVAAAFAGRPRALVLLAAGYAHVVILLGAGLSTIGVSGLVAGPLGLVFGAEFISGQPPIETLDLGRCAELARYHPGAAGCADASSQHFFEESVAFRIVPGVLGGLLMASHLLLLRRLGLRGAWSARPARGTALIALAISLVASGAFAAATLAAARDPRAVDGFLAAIGGPAGAGSGWWISVSAAALAAAAVSGVLTRALFRRSPTSV